MSALKFNMDSFGGFFFLCVCFFYLINESNNYNINVSSSVYFRIGFCAPRGGELQVCRLMACSAQTENGGHLKRRVK